MVALATDPVRDERTRPWSTGHVRAVHTYLDHHLPPTERDEALTEALEEARHWGDTELEDVLRGARRSLVARTLPDPESEAAVLVERCGLDATTAAAITGLDEVVTRRAANVLAVQTTAPVRPDAPGTAARDLGHLRRQERLTRVGIAALLGVAVLALIGLVVLRGDVDELGPPTATRFEVTSLAVTDDPAEEAAREPFPAGERVFVRIDYRPGGRDVTVDLALLAPDGSRPLDTGVRLPRVRERVEVPIPGRLLERSGDYRAGVRLDDETLAEVSFTVDD